MDATWISIIGGTVGAAGFLLSIVNWQRLRPAVFLVGPNETFILIDGVMVPFELSVEIHNAGASGVTISAIGIAARGQKLSHHKSHLTIPHDWFSKEAPFRIEPYGTEVVTLDIGKYRKGMPNPVESCPVFSIEWYGRVRFWKLATFSFYQGHLRFYKSPIVERRVRRRSVKINLVAAKTNDRNPIEER